MSDTEYPQIDYTERDQLVDAIYAELDPDGDGWAAGDGPTVDEVVKALLASDWLAEHDAQVRAEALRGAVTLMRKHWGFAGTVAAVDDPETSYSADKWLEVYADWIEQGEEA